MFNHINDRETPNFKFDGFYRGKVVDNNDPKQAGRIKIEVFGVFDGLNADHLPWAVMADPLMGGLGDNGSIFVPNMDSHVFLFFEGGDHRHPVYFAGAPAIQDGEPDAPSESREEGEYPNNKVFKTKAGITIEMDDSENSVRFKVKHPSGTNFEVDNDGDYTIEISGDGTFTINGQYSLDASGEVSIKSGAQVSVQAPLIQLN